MMWPPAPGRVIEGLWFALLGPVRGWLDGAELELGSPDQRAVLAFLLLREGRPATAGEIIDAVWGEDAPRSVQGVLRTYVYRLRRLFSGMPGGDPLIESVGGGYVLPVAGESVDARVFQQRVAEGRRARQEGDPARAAVLLGEGLSLWQGTPLSGMRGLYADRQRQRLEQLHDGAREERFAADVERGAHREVIPALTQAVADSPLRERLRELLMLALYRAGRQAEALDVYNDAYRVLDEELGIAPGAALRELHGAILRADPGLDLPMGQDGPGLPAAPVPVPVPAQLPPATPTGLDADPGAGGVVIRPGLFQRLGGSARVSVVSAPPGSGKTVLLRSWIAQAGLGDHAGWVAAGRDDCDPRRFWLSVLDALRRTAAGSALVQEVTAAPDLDGWAVVERLLRNLAALRDPVWLVIDDVHELGPEVMQQLELLVLRAPPALRFVLATRQDVRLGLHRLRLEGGLVEIRAADLRFSAGEAGELFAAAGLNISESTVALLHERTEGWAAGLRLAALSLAGHPDPERFAEEFSGSDRTVAEYLLAEVLDRQPGPVRRLLLRTSILERVNGKLADLLTGDDDGERVLQDLEEANAFVVSLDGARSWFRYHPMFAGLLALELRRTEPGQVTGLRRTASQWFATHGYPVEAIRHAQAAEDWDRAARLLADYWPGLHLDGRATVAHELLAGFPAGVLAADAELGALIAADELAFGTLDGAERYLGLAERAAAVPEDQRAQAQLLLGIVRLQVARQRGNLLAEAQEAQRLRTLAGVPQAAVPAMGEELRALALMSLGYAEGWTARSDPTGHLEQGIMLARRTGRSYLEFTGLAYQSAIEAARSLPGAEEHSRQAIELAEHHGWSDETVAGVAYTALGGALAWQGRLDEAATWLHRADLAIKPEAEALAGLQYIRGQLLLARGQAADALATFQAAERLVGQLAAPHPLARPTRAWLVSAMARLGQTERAEKFLAGLDERERESGGIRIATAALRLAQDDPDAALAVLGPVLDHSVRVGCQTWLVEAFLLAAIARDALGDLEGAQSTLERALDLAESGGALLWFLLHPVPELLERLMRHGTAHADLIAEIKIQLKEEYGEIASPRAPARLTAPMSQSELRVLRYLPTNLTAPEIADQLFVSPDTVKTHVRNLHAKLGTHHRSQAVERARDLGLLARPGASLSQSR
jgi:LuxR family transcriptional regulator, maltose regulon positive regulatory protein